MKRLPNPNTQTAAILRALRAGKKLTALRAERLCGSTRAAARINDLRRMGWIIEAHRERHVSEFGNPGTHAVYWIDPKERKR